MSVSINEKSNTIVQAIGEILVHQKFHTTKGSSYRHGLICLGKKSTQVQDIYVKQIDAVNLFF